LFAVCLTLENAVFTGCKIEVEGGEARAALVRTNGAAVLVIDGSQTLSRCTDFLANRYGGSLDAVVVLSDDELDGVNVGAFLPAKAVYAKDEIATGLQETEVRFGDRFSVNGLEFRYESRKKLALLAEGAVVEFDFSDSSALGADLFIEKGSGGLKFFLKNGIIRSIA
ncbi:MAG: hypothetical protein K2H43_00850, partial [Clostridia bacterium]|nr:hypothetical protein [Clostridia bacterium]